MHAGQFTMSIKYLKRLIFDRTGQAMTEFVIVLPVLLLLFLAIIFFGKAYLIKANTQVAARYYTWGVGRKAAVSKKRLSQLFFEGDPSKIEIKEAETPSIAGFDSRALKGISKIFDVLGGTEMKTVSYTLGPLPFRAGEIKLSSSHYVDIDPWKGKGMVAMTLLGIGFGWGYFIDPVRVPPCPASIGALAEKLVGNVFGRRAEKELRQIFDSSVAQLQGRASNYARNRIQNEFLKKLEGSIEKAALNRFSGVMKGVEGQISSFPAQD